MKSEVYSWRVTSEIKTGLEREARRRNISLSAALDLAAREWLDKSGAIESDEEQCRVREAASRWLGALASGDARRSKKASQDVRTRLRRHYGR